MIETAAYLFASLVALTFLFQWALVFGAPLGHLSMGGKYPGKIPLQIRIAVALQSFILVALAMLILCRANVAFPELYGQAEVGAWVAVCVSALALILNVVTPSKWERILWAPVALVMLTSALIVANAKLDAQL